MTPQNRAIWADAYRLMEKYETPPAGSYDDNKAFWDGLNDGIADLCKKYRNDQMAWKLSVAIFEAVSDMHTALTRPTEAAEQEIQSDAQHMLFKPSEGQQSANKQQPEQTRLF